MRASQAQLIFTASADGAETHLLLAGQFKDLHTDPPPTWRWAFNWLWARVLRGFSVENAPPAVEPTATCVDAAVLAGERPVASVLFGWAIKKERDASMKAKAPKELAMLDRLVQQRLQLMLECSPDSVKLPDASMTLHIRCPASASATGGSAR